MPQAKTAKPEQFFDASVMNELDKEGILGELAKRYPAKGVGFVSTVSDEC